MQPNKRYAALDYFRIVAAFLIVAIHTSPFSSINKTADFMFTYCFGRVGVPFFLMVTGYFVLGPLLKLSNNVNSYADIENINAVKKVKRNIIKICYLYIIATILFFPISWYAGNLPNGMLSACKDIFFEGTFYHLWYLPAAILGSVLILYLIRWVGLNLTEISVLILYIIGLFGDSYYKVSEQLPILKRIYTDIFTVSHYTRNGIFYAPIFLLLGALLYKKKKTLSLKVNIIGLVFSMIFMLTEGYMTYHFKLQRHNSMYVFLLPVMFFLFELLLYLSSRFKKQDTQKFKDIALWVYILHPLCIIIIRGAAKVVGQTHIMVNNSLIHYILVCILSFIFAFLLTKFIDIVSKFRVRKPQLEEVNLWKPKLGKQNANMYPKGRAWLEIDFNNLQHNVNELKKVLPEACELMPAVKADAYGHGTVQIAKKLRSMGINHYCVACALEGVELRKSGVKGEILIFGYTAPEQFDLLRKYNLTQTIVDAQYGLELKKYGKKLSVHIAIDTGMHRLGIPYDDRAGILTFLKCKNLSVTGIYSHLCVSDSYLAEDREFTLQQIKRFDSALQMIKDAGYTEIKAHLQSSYGILNYPELYYDFARPGIALYGILSNAHDACAADVNLKPVLALKSKIESVKFLQEGESAGYGLAYTAEHDMLLAVASIGYADGVPRKLSCENGYVLLHGKKVPIVGRICMDQMLINVTDVRKVKPGDEIVIIGKSGEQEITACDVANWAGTISNEILSRLGKRLERVYLE